jgi:hypothetical protein
VRKQQQAAQVAAHVNDLTAQLNAAKAAQQAACQESDAARRECDDLHTANAALQAEARQQRQLGAEQAIQLSDASAVKVHMADQLTAAQASNAQLKQRIAAEQQQQRQDLLAEVSSSKAAADTLVQEANARWAGLLCWGLGRMRCSVLAISVHCVLHLLKSFTRTFHT